MTEKRWKDGKGGKIPNRSGTKRITLDLDPGLSDALSKVIYEAGNVPLNTFIYKMLRDWFAGVGTKGKRQIIPIPVPLKRGPKKGYARKVRATSTVPSTDVLASVTEPVDESHGGSTTK
jgi:DNA primase